MKFEKIEIENFRSIKEKIAIDISSNAILTLGGANNCGKSNILRAINLFFTRYTEPDQPFDRAKDLPKGSSKSAIITITFLFEKSSDPAITKFIDKECKEEFPDYRVKMALTCYANGTLTYSLTNIKGQRKSIPKLSDKILEYVDCVYIPSVKDFKKILNNEITRNIIRATFQGFGKGISISKSIGEQKERFDEIVSSLQKILDGSGDYASKIVSSVIPSISRFRFALPSRLEDFLGLLLLEITETDLNEPVGLESVGSGVQGFTIYSILRLLHELRPINTHRKAKFLWLIEEPETFMHHDLQKKTLEKLRDYSKEGAVFISTHSPIFIDKKTFVNTYWVQKDQAHGTVLQKLNTKQVIKFLSGGLGVRFEDFMPISRYTFLVEGETDKNILTAVIKLFSDQKRNPLEGYDCGFFVCGSASSVPHFYGMFNAFKDFADFIPIFDRDDAGKRSRDELISKGISKEHMVLMRENKDRPKTAIEDLVDRVIWEKCLATLDKEGLITIKSQQGKVVDWEYEKNQRFDVKKRFSELLVGYSQSEKKHFERYHELLVDIASVIQKIERGSTSTPSTSTKRPRPLPRKIIKKSRQQVLPLKEAV